MGQTWSSVFPPKPQFTEEQLLDQTGKVFIVTGSSSGLGRLLAGLLYQRNGRVYIAARSEIKAGQTINDIKRQHPHSNGQLIYLHLDLNDLTTIKASAEEFLGKESRLDVLFNNAGVMVPPQGSKTAQGYELQLGTNNIAPFLFTSFLHPLLRETAKVAPKNSVRVIWLSSSAAENHPNPPIDFANMDYHREEGIWTKYGRSKAGNILHSTEFARRTKEDGVLSLSVNPGIFMTNLQRHTPKFELALFKLIARDPILGAYTQIYAGFSPEITEKESGKYIIPYGRLGCGPKALMEPALGRRYWDWTEEQVKPYI